MDNQIKLMEMELIYCAPVHVALYMEAWTSIPVNFNRPRIKYIEKKVTFKNLYSEVSIIRYTSLH